MWVYRRIIRISWTEKRINETILNQCSEKSVFHMPPENFPFTWPYMAGKQPGGNHDPGKEK